ncbi:hypothetical protein [Mycobacterium sp. IDR2000157661]|uniref:hypothetical protein n=1 Tax=Mycobacterium sp. IDR2000157661 TaxID=2867005 RepID=UPI001EEAE62B|nr:hypothetical protein [Mycobacterium sp. IDR2000157661]ULE33625.1 hypothetical protein K3G64_02635 [Mycobacterium sp. IDR2000157661]
MSPLTPELVSRMLNNMAAHGPATRVGLIPTGGTRKWKFDRRPGDTAVNADLSFDDHDVNEMLTQFMQTSPDVPIQVVAPGAGDYVCMYVDHGVGDAHLIIEMFVALSQAARYGDFVPPLPGSMTAPLLSCFWNATKSEPKGMWSDAVELVKSVTNRRRSGGSAPLDAPAKQPAGQRGTATAVFVKSRMGYLDELRAYRAATGQTATVTTYVIRSLYHAFRDAGVDLSDDVLVMMDLRRFLPPEQFSLANLSAPVVLSVTPDMSAEEVTLAALPLVTSRKPLLRMMGRSLAARLKGLPAAEDVVESHGVGPKRPLTLSISDVTKIPASGKMSWPPGLQPEDINLAIALESPDPSYVNICMITAPEDRAMHLTATFYDSRLDPEVVRAALKSALEIPGSPRPQ